MSNTRNKEYTPPTTARCREDAERIKRETEAFLANGGSIKKLASDIKITDAHKKTETKRKSARKRGMKKMAAA